MVTTLVASKPASTLVSRAKLRMSSPAPETRTKARATCATTSPLRSRALRRPTEPLRPPSLSASMGSHREA